MTRRLVRGAGAARPDEIRRHNLGLLLEQVHRDGELTRAELTRRLGLNRSTIGALVADLTSLGLLAEHVPSGSERAGRPSHQVGPRPDGPYVVAVDIEVDRVTGAAVGLGGRVLARRETRLEAGRSSPADVAEVIAAMVDPLGAALPAVAWPVGLAASIPGTIRRTDGVVEFAPNLHWQEVGFADLLAAKVRCGLPIHLGNDADLGALAEHLRGAGRQRDDVVFLNGKIGVGAGIIADGHSLRGHDGLAGEIGHVMLDPDGPPCRCGGRGCVETYIGEGALLRLAGRTAAPSRESVHEIVQAARAGEARALNGVRAVGVSLGRTVASLVNLLNPQVVIMGGSLSCVLDVARAEVETELNRRAMTASRRGVELRTAGLGEDSSLLGAAELAFRPLLADPADFAPLPNVAPLRNAAT
ncbi:MAG: ROK family transcriptional regulator [Actinomycetota bacterium]